MGIRNSESSTGSLARNSKPGLSVNSIPQHLHHRLLSRLSGNQFCMSFQIRGILVGGKIVAVGRRISFTHLYSLHTD